MIETAWDGDVAVVTLRRPDRRNALDLDHCRDLLEAVTTAERAARAVVLTGEGTSFCAGADLDGVYGPDFRDALYALLEHLVRTPVPVVAAVNGPAIGAGTQLAVAADLRVVAPTAKFAVPTARNGLAVDTWTIRRLTELVGGGVARRVLLGCETLDADAAATCGLADRTGDLGTALDWARELASLAPLTLAYTKLVLNSPDAPAEEPRLLAAFDRCWDSEDLQEGRRARAERRAPVFRGR